MLDAVSQFLISLIFEYRYVVLFPIMVIEGPIATLVSGFLVSINLMNPFVAMPIIVVGDLVGDSIYYCIGKFGKRWRLAQWMIRKFKFESVRGRITKSYEKHGGKLLLFGKLTHAIGALFLVGAGYTGMGFFNFLWYNFIGTVIKSGILLYVGYWAGTAYMLYARYFEYGALVVTGVSLVVIYMVFSLMPRISHLIFNIPPENPEEKL